MLVKIIRCEESEEHGTLGSLLISGELFCTTLEPKDADNKENISCIPTGYYHCKRINSPRFGNVFEVSKVPNRTHILFHAGNTDDNTSGCILLGQYPGKLANGDRATLNSGNTFKRFMDRMIGLNEFDLLIIEVK